MIKVDDKEMQAYLRKIGMTTSGMVNIAGNGAKVLVNGMRLRVPVDTGATRGSVNSHIVEATETRVVDDVGPETDYAPAIELGVREKPGYPIQPFVRPTAVEDLAYVVRAIASAFSLFIKAKS